MDKSEHQKQLRQRERAAAEKLLNDSSLRENINDDQAQSLLDWGFDLIGKAVEQTKTLTDDAAEEKLNKMVERLKDVMRAVDLMVEQFAESDEKQATLLYQKFLEALQYLQPVPIPTMQKVEQVVKSRQDLGQNGTFDHLLNILC